MVRKMEGGRRRSMDIRGSSCFFPFLLKFFHHDAKSRLLGGEVPGCVVFACCVCVGVYGVRGVVCPAATAMTGI